MIPEPIHDVEALATLRPGPTSTFAASGVGQRIALGLRICIVAGCCAILLGFFAFIAELRSQEDAVPAHADGIVALTGGSERISDALDLLADGHADRLLITGVNRSTSSDRLAQIQPQHHALFTCCIDVDYQARNTVGNAVETKLWVNRRGIRSLIVVTSAYHMPRAMLELQRALPGIALQPYPVTPERPAGLNLLARLSAVKILATEYGKFLAAYARAAIFPSLQADPNRPSPDAAGSRGHRRMTNRATLARFLAD